MKPVLKTLLEIFTGPIFNENLERIKPTIYAYSVCMSILSEVNLQFPIPDGTVEIDDRGSIRIDWMNDNGRVAMCIPFDNGNSPYIYSEESVDDCNCHYYSVDANSTELKIALVKLMCPTLEKSIDYLRDLANDTEDKKLNYSINEVLRTLGK